MSDNGYEPIFIDEYLRQMRKPKALIITQPELEHPPVLSFPAHTIDPVQTPIAEASFLGGLARQDAPVWARKTARIYYGWSSAFAVISCVLFFFYTLLSLLRGFLGFPLFILFTLGTMVVGYYYWLIARHTFQHTPPVFEISSDRIVIEYPKDRRARERAQELVNQR